MRYDAVPALRQRCDIVAIAFSHRLCTVRGRIRAIAHALADELRGGPTVTYERVWRERNVRTHNLMYMQLTCSKFMRCKHRLRVLP